MLFSMNYELWQTVINKMRLLSWIRAVWVTSFIINHQFHKKTPKKPQTQAAILTCADVGDFIHVQLFVALWIVRTKVEFTAITLRRVKQRLSVKEIL